MNEQLSALHKLLYRCNEMDITEQLNWLGDANIAHQAVAELSAIVSRLQAVEALVKKWENDPALWMANDKKICAAELKSALKVQA